MKYALDDIPLFLLFCCSLSTILMLVKRMRVWEWISFLIFAISKDNFVVLARAKLILSGWRGVLDS